MNADILLQAAVLGLMQGGVYAIMAAGLTVIYGVMKVVNFAHGEFITLGLYLTLTTSMLGLDPYATAPFVVAVVFILAAGIFRLSILPALDHPQINQMLITIGISFVIIGMVQLIWGANNRVVPLSWARDAVELGPVRLTYTRAIAFLTAMVVAGAFWWGLNKTRFGIAVRAAAQDPASARLCGINVRRAQLITFGAGAALAALAGVLMAPIFPMNPTIGVDLFLLPSFVIVVLGTMGNFPGALIGGLIIGTVEGVGGLLLGSSLRQLISLSIFVAILLVMPRGLFGGRSQ
ncbi:MAG: branched-chain amino acid ABC transporter permease [Pseudomonadota bacterium]